MTDPSDESGIDRLHRPAVAPPYVAVVLDQNRIQFRIGPWAGPAFTVRDHDADGRLATLVDLLDGRNSLGDVLASFAPEDRTEVRAALVQLDDRGVLFDAAESAVDPPVGGYRSANATFDGTARESMKRAEVVVVSIGTIGRFVARDLREAGVENVDLVTPTTPADESPNQDEPAGQRPVVADPTEAIPGADYVVCAAVGSHPEQVRRVNETTHEHGIPWASGRLVGLDGFIGPTVIPGETACHRCFRHRHLANLDDPRAYRRYESVDDSRVPGVGLPSMARVIAGWLTIEALHLVSTGTGFAAGRVTHLNFFELSVESNTVLKLPRCPVCGQGDRRLLDRQRHLSLDRLLAGE